MFKRISAVVLFVADINKSVLFYEEVLGLKVVAREPKFAAFKMDGQDFALNELSEGAELVNVPEPGFEAQTGKVDRALLCARVDDVDAAYEALKAKGVEFTRPPTSQPWGIRAAYFKDPDGNIWEIAHPLPKA